MKVTIKDTACGKLPFSWRMTNFPLWFLFKEQKDFYLTFQTSNPMSELDGEQGNLLHL